LHLANFCNRKEELKNDLATSRSKVRDLEISLREDDAGARELKQVMKEVADIEYTISEKLAYEKGARQGLEAEFEVVLKSLQSDQITIAGYEVELNDLKGVANYAMDCIAIPPEVEGPQSLLDHLIDTPNRLLTLLRAMSLAAATDALVRVKSHYPNSIWRRLREVLTPRRTLRPWSLKLKRPPWK
jgi:hypothetical protein